jgi:hypothetical protein
MALTTYYHHDPTVLTVRHTYSALDSTPFVALEFTADNGEQFTSIIVKNLSPHTLITALQHALTSLDALATSTDSGSRAVDLAPPASTSTSTST